MVSDDERREVAERMRSVAREVDRDGFSETIKHVKLAVFEDLDRYRPNGTLDRLADLIEPSCDREALLALASGLEADADRILRAARNARFGGGPRMGEAKHNAYEWRSIARRIREACGHRIVGKGEPTWL